MLLNDIQQFLLSSLNRTLEKLNKKKISSSSTDNPIERPDMKDDNSFLLKRKNFSTLRQKYEKLSTSTDKEAKSVFLPSFLNDDDTQVEGDVSKSDPCLCH
jgi:hypothetical protein